MSNSSFIMFGVAVALTLAAGTIFAQTLSTKKAPAKVTAADGSWLEDFKQAKADATAAKKPIFALFTGSDWCPWCVKLEKEILASKEFNAFAKENLVLFKADFPRMKEQDAATKKQNAELSSQYGVEGFPTVMLLDAAGKPFGQMGYQRGGGMAFVKELAQQLKGKGITLKQPAATPAK